MKHAVKLMLFFTLIMTAMLCVSCGHSQDTSWHFKNHEISSKLTYDHSMELTYATGFSVDYYNDGFVLISIMDDTHYLINTQNKEIPNDLNQKITVLNQIADHIYLGASAAMDMFCSIDAIDKISLSAIKEENWYISEAKEAMADGRIIYAGKYNTPDYELILSKGCRLAVESTMILHVPEVRESLLQAKIPVLVDYSSRESHPLGRTEWVKLYGALTGKEEEALSAFSKQEDCFKQLGEVKNTEKTVVFFYITSNKTVVVRKPNDYVAKMIELAGGKYLSFDLKDEKSASSSVNMQMEEFYNKARNVDYLVYNGTVDGETLSLKDLIEKFDVLKEFKAVQNKTVWCTTQNVYQDSMSSGSMIQEFHKMLTSEETEDGQYLFPLQ